MVVALRLKGALYYYEKYGLEIPDANNNGLGCYRCHLNSNMTCF